MLEILLNMTLIVLVLVLHLFINFKIAPFMSNPFLKFFLLSSSCIGVVIVFNIVFKFNK